MASIIPAPGVGDGDYEMLQQYINETQNLLNDSQGQFFTIPTLTNYINRSRRRIAAASGCLRVMPPGVLTVPNQETYPFSAWNALVQGVIPQTQSILACRSLAVGIGGKWVVNEDGTGQIIGGSWKPVWRRIVFTDFQARFRIYGGTFMGTISEPGWWTQFGEGPSARIYLAPIPTQALPMEVDLTVIPLPLLTDNDREPIPYPWTDAVTYWAAVMCLLQQQRREDAGAMAQLFNSDLPMCASVVCPQMIQSPYGATMRSA
jgi:hypothetical protein